jgi:hypothetical protein
MGRLVGHMISDGRPAYAERRATSVMKSVLRAACHRHIAFDCTEIRGGRPVCEIRSLMLVVPDIGRRDPDRLPRSLWLVTTYV